jgi:predicted N-acetyltransferase YhbS
MAVDGPRGIRHEELASLVDLADRVFHGDGPGSMADEYPLLYSRGNLENLRVFCDEGRAVAHVGTLFREVCLGGSRHLACLIGSVCCDPEYRGRGLATQLLEDSRARAVDAGADLFLISGGRGLYRRLGYADAGDYPSYTV